MILSTLNSSELDCIGPLGNPLPTACTSIDGMHRENTLVFSYTHSVPLSRIASCTYGETIQKI